MSSSRARLALIWGASLLVVALALITSFRLGVAEDLPTLWKVNGGRVALGVAAGAAYAVWAGLRLDVARPLGDLQVMAAGAAAAGGGFLIIRFLAPGAELPVFLALAVGLGAAAWWLVGRLDRPRRWTNLVVAVALGVALGLAAVAGGFGRERPDLAPLMSWMLGDLSRADGTLAFVLVAAAAVLVVGASTAATAGARDRWGLLALGLALGATGPLPFAGVFAARAVARLAPRATERARLLATAGAGAAVVVAVDAVPRLMVGGYAFPFAIAAGVLAIVVLLPWNRARLRRAAGPAPLWLAIAEWALIAVMVWFSYYHAYLLMRVIHQLT